MLPLGNEHVGEGVALEGAPAVYRSGARDPGRSVAVAREDQRYRGHGVAAEEDPWVSRSEERTTARPRVTGPRAGARVLPPTLAPVVAELGGQDVGAQRHAFVADADRARREDLLHLVAAAAAPRALLDPARR